MKNSLVLLAKGDLLIRTSFVNSSNIKWLDEDRPLVELLCEGYKVVETDLVSKALCSLHALRDLVCAGRKVTNTELLDIIRMLEEY